MKRSEKTKRILAAVLSSVFAVPAVSDAGIFDDNLAYAETSMTAISTRQNDELAEENGWKMSPDGKFYFFVLDDGTVQISMWCEDTSEITVPETFEYEDETYTALSLLPIWPGHLSL